MLRVDPSDGEEGVATTRETRLEFSARLDPDSIDQDSVHALVDEARISARLHLSPDGRRITLFYTPKPLPSNTVVRVVLNGELAKAANGRRVDADGDGRIGGRLQIRFRTVDLTIVPNTDVCGRVFASTLEDGGVNRPLRGVTIRVDGLPNKQAVTDPLGNFCLRDLPAGRVFIRIDGSTAQGTPPDRYYPSVGKAWVTRAGDRINVGTIHLPSITKDTLQSVSKTKDTLIGIAPAQLAQIKLPDLAEQLRSVRVTVPADSLFADGGERGGAVGVAPVARDRLPGTLPRELRLPIVITVQTDGATNFDVPAPVCFPNLPDPITNLPLPPGAKTALWSFNHDVGRFEVTGTMTVSADGKLVCSDPGVGIRAPGWHGSAPGSTGDGTPPSDDGDCQGSDCGCNKTLLDLWATVTKLAATLLSCTTELAGIDAGCLKALVEKSRVVYDFAVSATNVLGGNTSKQDLVKLKNGLKGHIDNLVALISECEKVADPVARVARVIDCLQAVTSFAEHLCKEYDKCVTVFGKDLACSIIKKADWALEAAKALKDVILEYYQAGIKKAALAAAYKALELVCKYIDEDGALTPEQIRLLRQSLTDLATAIPAESTGSSMVDGILRLGPSAREVARKVGDSGSEVSSRIGSVRELPIAYAFELPARGSGSTRRGVTNSRGRFRMILPTNEDYVLHMYEAKNRRFGQALGRTAGPGRSFRLNGALLRDGTNLPDTDQDGLPDAAELVYGTRIDQPDTDKDGRSDGDEVHNGEDPLDGLDASIRIVADLAIAAPAPDICVAEGTAVLALGNSGVEVVNTYNGMPPARIAIVDTPGDASRVACGAFLVAVADGSKGLAVIDLRQPGAVRLTHQVPLGDVRAVASAGEIAFAATTRGTVSLVDMASGRVLSRVSVGGSIQALALRGDRLYAVAGTLLHGLGFSDSVLRSKSTTTLSRSCFRLFAAADHLFATHRTGFLTLNLADPDQPRLVSTTDTRQSGWRQIRTDGSGFGIGAVGLNSRPGPTDGVHLYEVRNRKLAGTFLRNFDALGFDQAIVSAVAIDNGLAYVADRRNYAAGSSGSGRLRVLRYVPGDLGSQAPQVSLSSNIPASGIEEGRLAIFRAHVSDDVQVRNVDFYVGGRRIVSDGSYPFAFRYPVPARATSSTLTVTARAWDTGGNSASAPESRHAVLLDRTLPTVVRSHPPSGGVIGTGGSLELMVGFSEQVAASSVTTGRVRVTFAGADGKFGTADDQVLPIASARYIPLVATATWSLPGPVAKGLHRVAVGGIRDVAGNVMESVSWVFTASPGLRLSMFSDRSKAGVVSLFSGQTPVSFEEYRAAAPVQPVFSSVVQHIDFSWVATPWLAYVGPDGKRQSSSLSRPVGDDVSFRATTGNRFGALFEGILDVPESGTVRFGAWIDNAAHVEIDDTVVLSVYGAAGGRYWGQPMSLSAGPHRIRVAFSDWGVRARLTLLASGGGFGGGVIPPSAFAGK